MHRSFLLVSVLLAVAAGGCQSAHPPAAAQGGQLPGLQKGRISVNLREWAREWEDDFPEASFSEDGRQICLWFGAGLGPVNLRVFDLSGHMVASSGQANYQGFLRDFPAVAWRWVHPEFVKDADFAAGKAFSFTSELSQGLRVVVTTNQPRTAVAEFWTLAQPVHKLWSHDLGGRSTLWYATPIGRVNDWTNGFAFIDLDGSSCAQLDIRSGEEIKTFELGPREIDTEASGGGKRSGGTEAGPPLRRFNARCIAFDENRGLMACGSFSGQNARVFEVARPERLVFEAHAANDLSGSFGGVWRVSDVAFFSEGKYLMTVTDFAGKLTRGRHIVEIYETTSWRRVWQHDDVRLHSVTLSPDGKTMAYVLATELVICPFDSVGETNGDRTDTGKTEINGASICASCTMQF